MKKKYVTPTMVGERFSADEYVAACYSLYCMISGDGDKYTGKAVFSQNKKYKNWLANSQLTFTPDNGLDHGEPCANGSSLDTTTGNYYEYHKKSAVGTIALGADAGNGKQYATWTSEDINGTGTYHHYGYAKLDDVNRPNHS